MKLFGILTILYMLYIIINKKSLEHKYISLVTYILCIELFMNCGFLIKINGYELLYSEAILTVLFLFSIHYLFIHKFNIKIYKSAVLLLVSIFITVFLLLVVPYSEIVVNKDGFREVGFSVYSLLIIARVVIFIVIAIAGKSIISKDNLLLVINRLYKVFKLVYIVIIAEYISKLFGINIINKVVAFLYGVSDSTLSGVIHRGGLNALQGLMKEPAQLANGLFIFIMLFMILVKDKKQVKINLFFTCFILVMSGSFSSLIYVVILLSTYCLVGRISSISIIILLFSIPIIIIYLSNSNIFIYYYNRLLNSVNFILNNDPIVASSEYVRLNSIKLDLNTFFNRPLWGIGLGISSSFGFISSILSSIGFIGTAVWAKFVIIDIASIKKSIFSFSILTFLFIKNLFIGDIGVMYSIVTLIVIMAIGVTVQNKNNIQLGDKE